MTTIDFEEKIRCATKRNAANVQTADKLLIQQKMNALTVSRQFAESALFEEIQEGVIGRLPGSMSYGSFCLRLTT